MEWRKCFPHFVGTPQGGRGTLEAIARVGPHHRHWRVKTSDSTVVEVCVKWTGSESATQWADKCSNER